jgi:transposase
MIGPGTGVRVYLACGVTDMRKGSMVWRRRRRRSCGRTLARGRSSPFRGRRGDRLKLLTWDGQGFCLYYKVLEKGRFPWPSPADGVARLTAAQLAVLWEGIDWRRPSWSAPPGRVA